MIKIFWLWYNGDMDPSNNNSFGSFGPGANAPDGSFPVIDGTPVRTSNVANGSGDVVLPMTLNSSKKPRRGPLIAAIAVVIVIIVGVVVAWLVPIFRNNTSISELDRTFNIFANYVLLGENSSKSVTYSDDGYSKIEDVMLGLDVAESEKKAFVTESTALWSDFYNEFISSRYNNADYSILYARILYIEAVMNFLSKYYNFVPLTETEVRESFFSDGVEQTKRTISERYDSFSESNSSVESEYGDLSINYLNRVVDDLQVMRENGCANSNIDYSCIINIDWSAIAGETAAAYKVQLGNYVSGLIPAFMDSVIVINDELKSPTVYENVEDENE